MHFIHFSPKAHGPEMPEQLAYAFEQKPAHAEIIGQGPDGGTGVLWFDQEYHRSRVKCGYYPDVQTWQKWGHADLYTGYFTNQPPTPEDLRRTRTIPGLNVKLGDDNEWEIPIVRQYREDIGFLQTLPREAELDGNGEWTSGTVMPEYAELDDAAWAWFEFIKQAIEESDDDDQEVVVEIPQVYKWCQTMLEANYKVGPIEILMLKLFNDVTRPEIMNASIDLPGFIDNVKKKEPVEQSHTSHGAPATIPVTVPA